MLNLGSYLDTSHYALMEGYLAVTDEDSEFYKNPIILAFIYDVVQRRAKEVADNLAVRTWYFLAHSSSSCFSHDDTLELYAMPLDGADIKELLHKHILSYTPEEAYTMLEENGTYCKTLFSERWQAMALKMPRF